MRLAHGLFASCFLIAACTAGSGGGDDTGDDGDDTVDPPEYGFRIETPEITIAPGEEVTYCYFTTVDIDEAVGVKRWSSTMTPGSHHLIVYFTDSAGMPDGTVTEDCDTLGGAGNIPVWTYSAGTPEHENVMPAGVGMTVDAQQTLFVQLHYFNATPNELQARAIIDAETYAPAETYTPAAAFISFHTGINIPAGEGQEASVEGTCTNVPDGANFFTLSTHAHKRAVRTEVHDGTTMIFESTDWEHPGETDWRETPYQFSGDLRYRCDYVNDRNQAVGTGDSADTDEMCMAVGYFYPASESVFCLSF